MLNPGWSPSDASPVRSRQMRGAVLVRGAAGSGDQVMSYTDEDERRVRIELMQADIDNKRADTAYKRGLCTTSRGRSPLPPLATAPR
jgi:hypothetical protein